MPCFALENRGGARFSELGGPGRVAAGQEVVGYGEGVFLSPLGLRSGEGAVPSPQKIL